MKNMSTRIFGSILLTFSIVFNASAQNFFSDAAEAGFARAGQKRVIVPSKFRAVKLDTLAALGFFRTLPSEQAVANRNITPVITIPMPDGTNASFHVWESSTLAPELALRFPNLKTFTGQGITDRTATIKLDWTENGFHAMILSPVSGSVFIDPYDNDTHSNYISYFKNDFRKSGIFKELPPKNFGNPTARPSDIQAGQCIGTQLKTYRLAVACTGEYAVAVKAAALPSPTLAGTLSAITTSVNRVNGVYETEIDVRLVLVATETSVIFIDATTDPFDGNNDAGTLIDESQSVIDSRIGNANYDIGHTFSTGGGGLAGLGVVCRTGQKGSGITGSDNPVGDPYDIDYVAHEMGHQFGGNHTFNSVSGSCGGNGESTANAEPGSGTTIMAYAGICGNDNIQPNSDPQFHAISFNEITTYSINSFGFACAVKTATNNNPPVVNAGSDYIIPANTPFLLNGTATDPNGDALTYSWEQIDVGGSFGAPNSPSATAPLFRSFPPVATGQRYFPKIADIRNNTATLGEKLPTIAREMNFRLTARDNKAGGAGVCFDEMKVTSVASTAFTVTYPTAAGVVWYVNDFKTVTWNPVGTAAAPINCANVTIQLSIDGGFTYPITILASTPNDGTQEIQVPNNLSTQARIRVMAVGNIFFDISNTNFIIQNSPAAEFAFNNPASVNGCAVTSLSIPLATASLNSFSTAISLTATGAPAGSTVTFGTNPVTPGGSTTVVLNNVNTLAAGTYNITVTGTAGAVTKSRVVSFAVSTAATPPTSLTTPAASATGIAPLASFNWSPVAGASSYILEISTSSSFSSLTQTVTGIVTLPYTLTTPLVENTAYYWRVKTVNTCGTSAVSASSIFKTGITVCASTTFTSTTPRPISASGTPTVTSTITIPAGSGATIADLNVVGLSGTHSYVSDLTFTLTNPQGTSVILFDGLCEDQNDFDINLDDEATAAIACPLNVQQTARPQNPLSAFDGQNSAGVWTLTVKDNFADDGGILLGWGLSISACSITPTPLVTSPWTKLCPPMSSVSLTSNITGATYQWQLDSGSGYTNISNGANYSGVTTATLQLNNIPSSWTGYKYRCIVNTGTSDEFVIGFVNTWTGATNTAWETPGNWSCNVIPDQYTDVLINSGTPIVNSTTAICRSIRVNPAATVTVNTGFKLTVAH